MADQWIDAAAAVSLVMDGPHDLDGMRSLCVRAHTGLVQTRARLFIARRGQDEKRQEDTHLPAGFWWAEGHEALEQNWAAGDFSTWIKQKEHLRAFGVTFALSGVLEMFPADQRALITRRVSVAGNPAWIPAREASQFAETVTKVMRPGPLVLEQARLGLVAGRAMVAQRFQTRELTEPVWEGREWDVPSWFWASSLQEDDFGQKWDLDQFSAAVPASAGGGWMTLSGVHFLTESLQILRPATEQTLSPVAAEGLTPPEAPPKFRGGRPAQPWWDDMWCAVWSVVHQGDFKPETKADIERAMLTWATLNGHEVSDAAVRPKARKLFDALNTEARNFLDP